METVLLSKGTMNNVFRRLTAAASAAGALIIAGTAQAALQDRDLDGDRVIDAFYDTDLDITWLRNANVVGGEMDWFAAVDWAHGFTFAGYDDWRLPTSDDCFAYGCTDSEMGHLWYVELGNPAGAMTNTGSFQNLQTATYWSGTQSAAEPGRAWSFFMQEGYQANYSKFFDFYAMAVRPGDVPAVPEPQAYLLALAGLAALVLVHRRRS